MIGRDRVAQLDAMLEAFRLARESPQPFDHRVVAGLARGIAEWLERHGCLRASWREAMR
jgi:hypothetical protein